MITWLPLHSYGASAVTPGLLCISGAIILLLLGYDEQLILTTDYKIVLVVIAFRFTMQVRETENTHA